MPLKLTKEAMLAIFPAAPQAVIDAFVAKQWVLDKAGITHTQRRLAWFFANIEHECGGFTIKNLTENIGYTHQRVAEVWPNRYSSAAAVRNAFGSGIGWQLKAIDKIYGNRMGNRPGTRDGSTFIGRGGPQWTGRDGYEALGRILTTLIPGVGVITAERAIAYAVNPVFQPEVCTAFWMWKNLNRFADANNWIGLVKAWNGGTNGLADRNVRLAGNDPHIKRLEVVDKIVIPVSTLPEKPKADPEPGKPTNTARNTTTGGAVVVGGAVAAGTGAYFESWMAAGMTLGIVAMISTTIFVLWRRK